MAESAAAGASPPTRMDRPPVSWPPPPPEAPSAVRVAAVHAAPAYLDRDAASGAPSRLIAEAAARGARLIAFPETFVPGYPYWLWTHTPRDGASLYANSIALPGEEADRIGAAARAAKAWVAIGVSEREGARSTTPSPGSTTPARSSPATASCFSRPTSSAASGVAGTTATSSSSTRRSAASAA
ncbi:MAG: nitrilase-related carbon-nitrogen hydrolase [Solirubrobacteraceae bacterium]